MPVPVNVYAESTPNPQAMKFVASMMLLSEGVVEYNSPGEAAGCPLALQLFQFTGVRSVFVAANFVTVIKDPALDWFDLTGIIREFIRGYLMAENPVFDLAAEDRKKAESPVEAPQRKNTGETGSSDPVMDEKIIGLLEEYVMPAVAQDGGAIQFLSFNEGVVTLALKGSCSGCPSSVMTLKNGIENLLKSMVPEVREVVAHDA